MMVSGRLPLYGFVNPTAKKPTFLVPLFGQESELWVQDGEDKVTRFLQTDVPKDRIIAEEIYSQHLTQIGETILHAFQFANGEIVIGSKLVIREALEEKIEEFKTHAFLSIDVLKFIGKLNSFSDAINHAKSVLAVHDPMRAAIWAGLMSDHTGVSLDETSSRVLDIDGPNTREVLKVLEKDLRVSGLEAVRQKARRILELSVDPKGGRPASRSDGLLYGLIQSGKTSIMTVTAAMAADNGFECILILTTDNDILYQQTLERVKAALRGITILGKNDWKDSHKFKKQLQTKPFGIVCSKNGKILNSLLDAFKSSRSKKLSVLIIDDEADQASLNTYTSAKNDKVSPINAAISGIRKFFPVNTYLQVTATPQALFLQEQNHTYHPTFTLLAEPGIGYVGGDDFFGHGRDRFLRIVDIDEVEKLKTSASPAPSGKLPPGLTKAVYTFLIAAACKIQERPSENFAFLCHVSMSKADHQHIGKLLDDFKVRLIETFQNKDKPKYAKTIAALKESYNDLSQTEANLPAFEGPILKNIEFYLKGTNIKIINAQVSDEITQESAFSIFVGGNKLGRGVTIKNLLVSYYGRNPKTPRADTVLQHARMYGYRSQDIGVTRLFLPQKLADHFSSIHQMEKYLRDLIRKYPEGGFEGLYISGEWEPTRSNVLDPNSIGCYIEGRSYNPRKPLRTREAIATTKWLDDRLKNCDDENPSTEVTTDDILELIRRVEIDPKYGAEMWNVEAIEAALEILTKKMKSKKAYLVVKRNRNLKQVRTESHGIIQSAEASLAPTDAPTLFMYRTNENDDGEAAVWWPQLRFPAGKYAISFSFKW